MSGHTTPIVVIGSGVAGLAAAAAVAGAGGQAIVLTAGDLTEHTASVWAQGGIAAALDRGDAWRDHAEDTFAAGAAYGQREVIDRITAAAPSVVEGLIERGVVFDRDEEGDLDLAREGGHGRARVAHVGDHTGAAITQALAAHVAKQPGVSIRERTHVRALTLDEQGAISGIEVEEVAPDGSAGPVTHIATSRVILATGGLGGLFPWTTNPLSARGEGIAMAARVGARTDDLHLVQFHPTALDVGQDPYPLLTEALRGAGATLLRSDFKGEWERFIDELQPRDVVSAGVWEQLRTGHKVVLDARAIPDVVERFPAVAQLVAEAGLDLTRDLLPVRPAVHYAMGGVTTDAQARTSVAGLWAVGEVSRTGFHGANRLASNSLLEGIVTGEAAAADALAWSGSSWEAQVPAADPDLRHPAGQSAASSPSTATPVDVAQVREVLGQVCGVLRDGPSLMEGAAKLREMALADPSSDAAYLGWLIARSALEHPVSVGAHRRTDDPTYTLEQASA